MNPGHAVTDLSLASRPAAVLNSSSCELAVQGIHAMNGIISKQGVL